MPPRLRRDVLDRVRPTAQRTREARRIARDVSQAISKLAKSKKLDVRPKLVGSLAKDTHLGDDLDIDVFVLFPPETSRKDLEKKGLEIASAVVESPEYRYAEHPYVHAVIEDHAVDIVPAYRLRTLDGRQSAVDRTPFHTKYVKGRITEKQRDEVRLLKRFLRGTRTYGAETGIGGLSGYLAELLILKYDTFARTVSQIQKWKPPVTLCLGGPAQMLGGPVTFVDPVDEDRNAAAALQPATLRRLQRACTAFSKQPGWEFFYPPAAPAWTVKKIQEELRRTPVTAVSAPVPSRRPGAALPQAQRLLSKVEALLQAEGFTIVQSRAVAADVADDIVALVQTRPDKLPDRYVHTGPSVHQIDHVLRFRQRWNQDPDALGPPKVAQGRWMVHVRRRHRTPREVLDPHREELLQGFRYEDARSSIRASLSDGTSVASMKHVRPALIEFLDGREPWQRRASKAS